MSSTTAIRLWPVPFLSDGSAIVHFTDESGARTALVAALQAAQAGAATDAFDGAISWGFVELPASPLDRLLLDHDDGEFHVADWPIDRAEPFVMVEANRRSGGFWLSTGASPQALVAAHHDQEYAEDWELVAIHRCDTAAPVDLQTLLPS
jgi:hypothetical protein